jgi:hypothetical protein
MDLKSFVKSFFSKNYDNPLNKAKLKIWYFTKFTANPKVIFLRKLNKRLTGWLLCVYSEKGGKIIYGICPTWGPLMVGDEMFINDPVISLDDINDAYYGFNGGLNDSDVKKHIPNDLRQWKVIWDKATKRHQEVNNKKDKIVCPDCQYGHGYGTGVTQDGHICPSCFGLGNIYTYGRQKEIGARFLKGSSIILGRNAKINYDSDGLAALIQLYRDYRTGIILNLVQDNLVNYAGQIIAEVFPRAEVVKVIDDKSEANNWNAWCYDEEGNHHYLHLYLKTEDGYINLFSGKQEIPSSEPTKADIKDVPNRDRWDMSVTLLENLCKYAK